MRMIPFQLLVSPAKLKASLDDDKKAAERLPYLGVIRWARKDLPYSAKPGERRSQCLRALSSSDTGRFL